MNREGQDYFFAVLDSEIEKGRKPIDALKIAINSYAYVMHDKDENGNSTKGNK